MLGMVESTGAITGTVAIGDAAVTRKQEKVSNKKRVPCWNKTIFFFVTPAWWHRGNRQPLFALVNMRTSP